MRAFASHDPELINEAGISSAFAMVKATVASAVGFAMGLVMIPVGTETLQTDEALRSAAAKVSVIEAVKRPESAVATLKVDKPQRVVASNTVELN